MPQLTGDDPAGSGAWPANSWTDPFNKLTGGYPGVADPSKFVQSPASTGWPVPPAPGLVYSQGQSSQSIWDELAAGAQGVGDSLFAGPWGDAANAIQHPDQTAAAKNVAQAKTNVENAVQGPGKYVGLAALGLLALIGVTALK